MLEIFVEGTEYYDRQSNTFFTVEGSLLKLEHSLRSMTEWEARNKVPFFDTIEHGLTPEQTLDYIKCMTLEEPKDPRIYLCIGAKECNRIIEYISDSHTATTFLELKKRPVSKKEKITAELIYYWMIESDIPFECDKWNLNNLMALIRVVSIKRSNGKMSKKERNDFNRALMAQRRAGK